MPQLVKGGKNAFAWSKVCDTGRIIIPDDAFEEYAFQDKGIVILMSGSKTSGGFTLIRLEMFLDSPISNAVSKSHPGLFNKEIPKGETLYFRDRLFCWTEIKDKSITLPYKTLDDYGVKTGDLLLTVRGSDLGLAFIVKGPIIVEAKRHKELRLYQKNM